MTIKAMIFYAVYLQLMEAMHENEKESFNAAYNEVMTQNKNANMANENSNIPVEDDTSKKVKWLKNL